MTERNGNGWIRNNAATLLSMLVILAGLAVAWGTMETRIRLLEKRMDIMEAAVRSHHEDTARHVDTEFKEELRAKLESITQLIHQHIVQSLDFYQQPRSRK